MLQQQAVQFVKSLASRERGEPWARRLAGLLLIVAVLLLASTAADVTWRILHDGEDTGPLVQPDITSERPGAREGELGGIDLGEVGRYPLFGQVPEPDERHRPEVPTDAPETRLNLSLNGVLATGGTGRGLAIIASRNEQRVYAVGAELPGDAELAHVHADRVILERAGEFEMLPLQRDKLELDGSERVIRPARLGEEPVQSGRERQRAGMPERPDQEAASGSGSDSEHSVERAELASMRDTLQDDPGQLSDMLRVRPVLGGGGLRGVRLSPANQRAEELFSSAGLRPDDIVTAVNDIPVSEQSELQGLVGELDTASQVRLRVERDGREQELVVRID